MSLFTIQLLLFFTLSFFSGIVLGRLLKEFSCKKSQANSTENILSNDVLKVDIIGCTIKLKSKGFFHYGVIIPNLTLNGEMATYEVVNEKAVRVQAAIMAGLGIIALANALLLNNWIPIKTVAALFFIDFFAKVIVGLKFSIFYQLSNWLVRKKDPEYVGAVQKRFAWGIGLILVTVMLYLQYIIESKGLIPLSLCTLCIVFMLLEWLFGFCIGCRLYYGLISLNIIKKPEVAPACPGGVCPINY
jgi:hypothetical protein